jgi:hypothetical protein
MAWHATGTSGRGTHSESRSWVSNEQTVKKWPDIKTNDFPH